MAKGSDVLMMLIPNGGWVITADDFDSIIYDEGIKPITKKEFEAGFAQFDSWKAERDATKVQAKVELLERLGITEDEAKLLLA
jgi:hypothetical protein